MTGGTFRRMATTTELQTYDNFVDGEWIAPETGETEAVLNPATGEEIARAPLSGEAGEREQGSEKRARTCHG